MYLTLFQGDLERKAGRTPSPFMDREQRNIPKGQVGFIDFVLKVGGGE